jgi:DNA-directed RNA polymerase subunit RPC12/RpoP
MQQTYDLHIRVLSCDVCGAPFEALPDGGTITCSYCSTTMVVGRRKLEPVRPSHALAGDARIAKLRLDSGRPLPDNPYSTQTPPPGCENLTRAGQPAVLEQLAQRFREAVALVRADPAFDHQRLAWWCATQLNQGYGMHDKHLERRAVLERAIEEIGDPGFRHMLFVNLAGAAARFGELEAAHEWIDKCDPAPEDILLDSGYRIGLASVLVREEGTGERVLELVGARIGDVPEAHQYRMLFAVYRIHACESLGRLDDAMAAAQAIARDPEIGGLVAEALTLNALAPKTAAALQSANSTSAEPKAEPVEAAVAKPPAAGEPRSGPNVGLLVAAILLIVLAIVAAVIVSQVLPAIRGAAP